MLKNSLLWQLSKDNGPKSFLFGTMHVQDAVAFTYLEEALNCMYKVTHFKSEIDIHEAQSRISPLDYCLPDQQTISSLVNPNKYASMCAILDKVYGLSLTQYDRHLPLIIINKLTESLLQKDRVEALDAHLWSEANRLKLICSGLETVEEQLATLKSLDIKVQIKMLKDLCRNINSFHKTISTTTLLYKTQNIRGLYKLTKKGLGGFKNNLLYSRNKIMASRIEAHMGTATFYAVGAAHLAGAYGVLPLLKKNGVKLKAIT